MAIDARKLEVAKVVCEQFMSGKATPRKPLIKLIKNGALLNEMRDRALLRDGKNGTEFYPTLGTFALLPASDAILTRARLGVLRVLHTLHNLYEVEEDGVTHTPQDFLIEVSKRYDSVDNEGILLGLYLVCGSPFPGLRHYGRSEDELAIRSFGVAEEIMMIDSPEELWDSTISSLRKGANSEPFRQQTNSEEFNVEASEAKPTTPRKTAWIPDGWRDARPLSEGGQAWTYLVRRKSGDDAEWKVFKRLKNPQRAPRFEAEVQALRAITHPGILKIVESGIHDGSPFYIAEYCENGDLSKRNLEGMTLLEKLLLFRKICSAVAAAHARGIVHRDLKPSNILMRADGSTVVGDFGLCLDLHSDERLTETQEAIGARNFMAPELEDGRLNDVSFAADVYSLGKLLYFLISGRIFSREKHREGVFDLTRTETTNNEVGMAFIYELLDSSIAAEPHKRYRDASALVLAIDASVRKIVLNAHVLAMDVPQHCTFCVEGAYRILGQASKFSMKLICFRCGNIQEFSSESNGGKQWWLSA